MAAALWIAIHNGQEPSLGTVCSLGRGERSALMLALGRRLRPQVSEDPLDDRPLQDDVDDLLCLAAIREVLQVTKRHALGCLREL